MIFPWLFIWGSGKGEGPAPNNEANEKDKYSIIVGIDQYSVLPNILTDIDTN